MIPGGVYGHQTPGLLVRGRHPTFLCKGSGCRITDADGNQYIDLLCAYGPMVVGYANPAVETAAARQRELCDSMDLPAPNMVELAERLVGLSPAMAWTMFAKNGSDVCSWALAVAREATARPVVAMVAGTYHGVHGWCNKVRAGFPDSERSDIVEFGWNDLDALGALFAAHEGKIAAVILTPFRHEAFEASTLAGPGFLEGVRRLCSQEGAVMIIDDIRTGFRLNMGCSTERDGVSPDIVLFSKALANGYPLAAMVGREHLREAARAVFVTGTFFTQAVPIAASLATLDELERTDGVAHMERVGRRLCEGLSQRAHAAGLAVTLSGPPAMPFMTFDEDEGDFTRSRAFAGACAENGLFLHPLHNWFVSTAHTDADIDQALEIAETAMAEVVREFGA